MLVTNTKLCFYIKKSGYKGLGVYSVACATTNFTVNKQELTSTLCILRYAYALQTVNKVCKPRGL